MIDQGRRQNAGNDGEGFLEACSQNEGQELGLVAHLRESDHTGRDEKCFHVYRGKMTAGHDKDA